MRIGDAPPAWTLRSLPSPYPGVADTSVRVEAENIIMAEGIVPQRLPEGVLEAFVTRRCTIFRLRPEVDGRISVS